MLTFIKANKGLVQKLLVVRWDRFSRNAPEAYNMIARLAKMGIEVNAIEQPLDLGIPENKIMLAFYLAAPEVENDRRAINTTNGMRRNMKEGRWVSTAPLGYKNTRDGQNKPILIKSDKADLIKKAFTLYVTGNFPMEIVRKQLYSEGLKVSKNHFTRILRNPVYCGHIKIKPYRNEPEETVKGMHEPIISEDLFYEVQHVMAGKKRFISKISKVRDEFPMRGFLLCNSCGGILTASCSRGRGGKYYYYHCQSGCKERITTKTVHDSFEHWLNQIAMRPEIASLYIEVMEDVFKANETDRESEIIRLESELIKKTEMLDKGAKKLINDELDKDDYKRLKESIMNESATLRIRINELKEMESGFMEYVRFGVEILGNLPLYYGVANLEIKQAILGSIFPEKLIFSKNTYRTAEPNELIDWLYSVDRDFWHSKKRKVAKNGDQFHQVIPMGLEPMTPTLKVLCSTN